MNKHSYRPDIDGLRAIAIGTVVLYHAFPTALPGGFIGVDVFFVISGFLISGIVFSEMEAYRFSFLRFYIRRICRIFPALALVLIATCAVGWLWLLPAEWQRLGQEIRGGAFFFANFVFLGQAGYFDQASIQKPLLHLWSLAIEEQFYLAWPVIVLLFYRSRFALGALIWVALIASLVLNLTSVASDPVKTFYMPTTRAWELLIGCLLAFRSVSSGTATARLFAAVERVYSPDLRALSGLALIAIAATQFDSHQLFPGWRAIFPTVGAALLISAGPTAFVNRVLLANPAAVFIGLISYPLYLWHWPILSLAAIYRGGTPGTAETWALVAAAVVCATATYYLIERPIRFGTSDTKRSAAAVLATLCIAIGLAGQLIASDHFTSNSQRYGLDRIVNAASEWSYPTDDLESLGWKGFVLRKYEPLNGPHSVLFFGDSNMEMYWPRVQAIGARDHLKQDSIYFFTYGGCPPIPDLTDVQHPYCAGFVDAAKAAIRDKDIKTVVLGAHWWGYLNSASPYRYKDQSASKPDGRTGAINALAAMAKEFTQEGRTVFAIMNIPYSGLMSPPSMIRRKLTSFEIVPSPVELTTQREGLSLTETLRNALDAAGVKIIDPIPSLCDKERCPTLTQAGDPIYRDAMHLRPAFVRSSATFLDQTLQ
ncbi:acyltransferase family protein [Bradyrhizobium sp. BEA-2-5]|uniref:acyltransferase family protein n=1 Tax=Bradyrhizobium sp. BEA-2-5 TaxID=3080015 RepID=UPI00293E7FF5|nr:acyltransferase family protein [Bradyrhizobium sp. BEA-2-5]WOH79042.1 acyltransferase family protein [Bradyrhizobium sp. BEA-2-5]